MPNIVLASSKGGAGKTTSAIILASELARQGEKQGIGVALIDADPNQHSAKWALKEGCPGNITLYQNAVENSLIDVIEEAEQQSDFVIIDLEGTASMSVGMAISRADLVIIPCQASDGDAMEAIKTIRNIKQQSKVISRNIPFAILFTKTNAAIVTRGMREIVRQFKEANLPILNCQLIDREAFRSIMSFGGTINDLTDSEVSGSEKAAKNAHAFAKEVITMLQGKGSEEELSAAEA